MFFLFKLKARRILACDEFITFDFITLCILLKIITLVKNKYNCVDNKVNSSTNNPHKCY